MNRRMRNRKSGGVGGRRGKPRLLPDLTLGDLCSDISQQGPVQDPEDWNLIERHAEIFPNFYLLPTPHLDRERLLELREFALNGVGHFRWLLCAIHQSTHQLYDLFLLWQKYRMEIDTR